MRWALIGTGRHAADRIVPALAAAGQSYAGGVGSNATRAQDFAARLGGQAYPDLAAALADETVDAVFVTTPNDQHRTQVERAAAAGKHVLVEKPMALTAADCEAMIAACAAAGVALGVGFQQRHAPVHAELWRMIGAGELGEVVLLRGEWHTAYPAWTNWRADLGRAGSDVLGAVGVHALDLLCWLAGAEATDVAALVDRGAQGQDRTVALSLRFANGVMAQMACTSRARAMSNDVFVLGTRGTARAIGTLGMDPKGRLETVLDGTAASRELPVVDLYAAQFTAFAAAVGRGEAPSASGADGLRSAILTQRILG